MHKFLQKIWLPRNDIDAPTKGILGNWIREGDDGNAPIIDINRFNELLSVLPDKVAENLIKARDERVGKAILLRAGLGYEDLLTSIILDGPAVGTSSAEAKLGPTMLFQRNYLQPSGAPTKTIRIKARGRHTTLTTAATMILRFRIATTDIITGSIIMQSGALTMDTTAQTNTMWVANGEFVVRSVGTVGTVFGMGDAVMAGSALTIANQQAEFMGVAGSTAPAIQSWDMTADQFFQFTAQWSLATAYSIQCHEYIIEALN